MNSRETISEVSRTKEHSFPRRLRGRKIINLCEKVSGRRQLTFPMHPQQGTRSRCFPFGERLTLQEPGCGTFVAGFTSNVMISPWVRGREPTSDISLKFVTCHANFSTPCSQSQRQKITDVSTCTCRSPFYVRFLTLSQRWNYLLSPTECT